MLLSSPEVQIVAQLQLVAQVGQGLGPDQARAQLGEATFGKFRKPPVKLFGDRQAIDSMQHDGLWCPFEDRAMGVSADYIAEKCDVSRDDQDAFAAESQRRAVEAIEAGCFDAEIAPVEIPQRKGDPLVVDRDEHPRPGVTVEDLARLRPVFKENGTVTAGNASGINDGAAALLVVEESRARSLGMEPLARVVATAVAGVEPHRMGMGPVPAGRLALERAGMRTGDLDLVELNEAFAAQALPCMRELDLDPAKVNVNGGAIALGHPVGCSGARILTTLVHEMSRREAATGMATMCIGVGQGIATVVST